MFVEVGLFTRISIRTLSQLENSLNVVLLPSLTVLEPNQTKLNYTPTTKKKVVWSRSAVLEVLFHIPQCIHLNLVIMPSEWGTKRKMYGRSLVRLFRLKRDPLFEGVQLLQSLYFLYMPVLTGENSCWIGASHHSKHLCSYFSCFYSHFFTINLL